MSKDAAKSTYKLEDQIGFRLRLANQKHLELFAEMMPEATPTQFAILARLYRDGKGVVDRLRSKGWVQSAPSTTDLRRLEISLTPEGTAFANTAIERAREISERTTQNLSARETDRLLALLDKL